MLILDRFIFRRLTQASDASKIMGTVGVQIAQPKLRTEPLKYLEGFAPAWRLGMATYKFVVTPTRN